MVTGTSDLALNVEWQHVSWDNWNGEPVGTLIMFNSSQGDSGIFTVPYPETTLMITGLHPITTYIITLCEVTRPGNGPCQQLKATTLLNTPSEAPGMLQIKSHIGHNELGVIWKPVPPHHLNGDLIGYKLMISLVTIGGSSVLTGQTKVKINSSIREPNDPFGTATKFTIFHFRAGLQSVWRWCFIFATHWRNCAYPPIIFTNYYSNAPYVDKNFVWACPGIFPLTFFAT
eukprot:Seg1759.9 transcript_id=Seg1759.9/GoldUCD/mRNA.D3Y31 product="Protein sidekick" protein_id=Seg1759.9/GoldUCD/D3Y31